MAVMAPVDHLSPTIIRCATVAWILMFKTWLQHRVTLTHWNTVDSNKEKLRCRPLAAIVGLE